MDLKGTIVTADAMNCQKGTAETIIDGKANVLAIKGNQALFYEEVRAYFDKDCRKAPKERPGCYKKQWKRNTAGSLSGNAISPFVFETIKDKWDFLL